MWRTISVLPPLFHSSASVNPSSQALPHSPACTMWAHALQGRGLKLDIWSPALKRLEHSNLHPHFEGGKKHDILLGSIFLFPCSGGGIKMEVLKVWSSSSYCLRIASMQIVECILILAHIQLCIRKLLWKKRQFLILFYKISIQSWAWWDLAGMAVVKIINPNNYVGVQFCSDSQLKCKVLCQWLSAQRISLIWGTALKWCTPKQ